MTYDYYAAIALMTATREYAKLGYDFYLLDLIEENEVDTHGRTPGDSEIDAYLYGFAGNGTGQLHFEFAE